MSLCTSVSCKYCGMNFADNRACTMHMKFCEAKNESNRKKPKLSQEGMLDYVIGLKKSSSGKTMKTNEPNTNTSEEMMSTKHNVEIGGNENNIYDFECDEYTNMHGNNLCLYSHGTNGGVDGEEYSTKQLSLLKQENEFQKRMKNTHQLWSIDDIGKLELLNILSKHNCTNGVYKDIMGWACFYNAQRNSNLFKRRKVESRGVVLKGIQKRRNMELMKPIIKKIVLGIDSEIPASDGKEVSFICGLYKDTQKL